MFNQFGQARKFTPQTPSRPIPGQTAAPTGSPSSFSPQIRPDFSFSAQHTNAQPSGPARRIQPDTHASLSPQSQRAALYDQARQQAQQESRFTDPRTKLSDMLPGGLTEKQRMDFKTLQITNPNAALEQLRAYHQTFDIRYNRPSSGTPPPDATFRRPPSNFSGPRRSF